MGFRSWIHSQSLRWFTRRAFDGWGPKLALVDAVLSAVFGIAVAGVWRYFGGARAPFETVVHALALELRWFIALPIAWAALQALDADRTCGLLALAERRNISLKQWFFGRAFGATLLVFLIMMLPLALISIVLAGFGGGTDGALARLSLLIPSTLSSITTATLFGAGAVALGLLIRSRFAVIGLMMGTWLFGKLLQLLIPGVAGSIAENIVSPLSALNDMQAWFFAEPRSAIPGLSALLAWSIDLALLFYLASQSLETPNWTHVESQT